MPRPRLTTDYQGKMVGARFLVYLLEEYIDRGRPNLEESEDILLVVKELTRLAMPKTNQRQLINRLRTIDRSRTALCWEEVEDKLHSHLTTVIQRYTHTHRSPRRIPAEVRRQLVPASRVRQRA